MSERGDAHFLHDARALEPLLSTPIVRPRAMAWRPGRDELYVADAGGTLHLVEPAFGMRELARVQRDAARIALSAAGLVLLGHDGLLQGLDADCREVWRLPTDIVSQQALVAWSGGWAVVGDAVDARRVVVVDVRGRVQARARVPERTALGVGADGALRLARNLPTGLYVGPFGAPVPAGEATAHRLQFGPGGHLAGLTPDALTVWTDPSGAPMTFKMLDCANATLHVSGTHAALGTMNGAVAICDLGASSARRVRPPRVDAHAGPVLALAFSYAGRFLASLAEGVRLWAW